MGNDILSRDEFDSRINSISNDEFDKCSSALVAKKQYAAALEKIAELEKQMKEQEREHKDIRSGNLQMQERCDELQAEVARLKETYEPEPVDTREVAEQKAIEAWKADIPSTTLCCDAVNSFFIVRYGVGKILWTERFTYSEPREPRPGDIMIKNSKLFVSLVVVSSVREKYIHFKDGGSVLLNGKDYKPTGYRVTESGAIVPINRG